MLRSGSSGFIDPTPELERQYREAVERLRREIGEPPTRRERWRFLWARYQLWQELVERPRRSANW
jgi:hypothetical protein